MKGRPTPKKHPPKQKQSLCKQFRNSFRNCPPFPCKTSREGPEEFAQTVWANCFIWMLGSWGGLLSLDFFEVTSRKFHLHLHSVIVLELISRVQCNYFQGRKKQHKHKLFGPDFPRTFLTLTPGRPWVKKFLPITGAAEKRTFGADVHDFRRGRPWPEAFSKNFVQKSLRWFFGPYIWMECNCNSLRSRPSALMQGHLQLHSCNFEIHSCNS